MFNWERYPAHRVVVQHFSARFTATPVPSEVQVLVFGTGGVMLTALLAPIGTSGTSLFDQAVLFSADPTDTISFSIVALWLWYSNVYWCRTDREREWVRPGLHRGGLCTDSDAIELLIDRALAGCCFLLHPALQCCRGFRG